MPVSVYKKASEDVSALHHIKNGVHHRDIFGNEDGRPPLTCGILLVTKHDSGGTTVKSPSTGYAIVTEGELSLEDAAKPGDISVLEPGDVIRIDKGTTITWSSPTSGKGMLELLQHKLGVQVDNILTGQRFTLTNVNSGLT